MKAGNSKRGITMTEVIIYVSILLIVVTVSAQSIFSILRVHRKIAVSHAIESAGALAMERMVREIRLAGSLNEGSSSFGVNPGTLSLSGLDDSGNSYTVSFGVAGNKLVISKNGGPNGDLTGGDVSVTGLIFEKATTANSKAVKVTLELQASKGLESDSLTLNSFVILRGSY